MSDAWMKGQSWLTDAEMSRLKPTAFKHISYDEDGYYFWDETGAYACGPFRTREDALNALRAYGESL